MPIVSGVSHQRLIIRCRRKQHRHERRNPGRRRTPRLVHREQSEIAPREEPQRNFRPDEPLVTYAEREQRPRRARRVSGVGMIHVEPANPDRAEKVQAVGRIRIEIDEERDAAHGEADAAQVRLVAVDDGVGRGQGEDAVRLPFGAHDEAADRRASDGCVERDRAAAEGARIRRVPARGLEQAGPDRRARE